jgi:DNA helicase-2/ATP-dependent DNA helicase PcrA
MILPLNPTQQAAANHTTGPLLIIAGAGTGKTKTLTHRIVNLIKSGVSPDKILAITFTNKAAKEMKERVLQLIDSDPDINRPVNARFSGLTVPFMSTFHSLGVYLLREFHEEMGLKRHFTIFDRDDSIRMVKKIVEGLGYDPKQHDPRSIMSAISNTKGDGKTYEHLLRQTGNPWKTFAGEVMKRYDENLHKEGALDFDDLLYKTMVLLKEHPEVREQLHKRWTHVHIDEYQDTNQIQFEMAQLLTGSENNICVVGDGDQLIYSWRGAVIENILNFEKEFPNTTVITLEENYRSTQTILAAANAIIKHNKKRTEKNLYTKGEEGEKISVGISYSGEDEARTIAETAAELIANRVNPAKIAVLYRVNFLSRVLEEQFLRRGVPYQVLGTRFFERMEVKDVLSYLKAALNPASQADFARAVSTPPRGIGKVTLAKMLLNEDQTLTPALQQKTNGFRNLLARIATFASQEKASFTIAFIIKESGLEAMFKKDGADGQERLENVKELIALATKYDDLPPQEGIAKLLDDAALATDQDSLEKKENSVKLMTIHASKGLEFDYVFIPGLEQGLFPHERMGEEKIDDEEERRLMYVALTRARKKLFLSYAMTRTVFGSQSVTVPSEFLNDIPEELLDVPEEGSAGKRKLDLIDF